MSSSGRPSPYDIGSPISPSVASQYPFLNVERPKGRKPSGQHVRRSSAASTITSAGLILDNGKETIQESSPNAISTLVQPSISRSGFQAQTAGISSGFKPPTQRDIPPVALTNIPHVDTKVFQSYLSQMGSLYDAFQRAKQEDEGDTSLIRREKRQSTGDNWEAVIASRLERPGASRSNSTSLPLVSPIESPRLKRRISGQRRQQAITPLSTIPQAYFDEDFHLENPRTFEIVSERSDVIRDPSVAPGARKTLATNAILQEKLSWYMDTVEVHLINSISTASKSFFSALGSLRELHTEATKSVTRVQKLRRELLRLDQQMAKGGLKVVMLKQRRDNVRKLADSVTKLEKIISAVHECEDKVSSGEIDTVLDDIDNTEKLLGLPSDVGGLTKSSHDLGRVNALRSIKVDLDQLRHHVGRAYEARFHDTLLNDLRKHVEVTATNLTLQRWGIAFTRLKAGQRRGPSTVPAYMSQSPELRQELDFEMRGLARTQQTLSAATTFRALFLREMKNTIKRQLPAANDDDNVSTISASTAGGKQRTQQERSSALSRNLKAMDSEDAYNMLANIYTNVSEGLRRLSVQVKLVLDITSGMSFDSYSSISKGAGASDAQQTKTAASRQASVQAEVQQALDLSSLLGEAVDAVQQHITKVVRVRSQQTIEMSLDAFLRYFTLHRLFADECEAISGRGGMALKSVLDGQIKEYVSVFTNHQRQELLTVMDSDKWDAKDFTDQNASTLDRVVSSSTKEIQAWTASCAIWNPSSLELDNVNGAATNGQTPVGKEKVRSAVVDEQRFILPESAISMLRTLAAFQHLASGIPGMTTELVASLIDTLKMFNSRSSQLILGAGATRSAGLKNITTKHLALSSQSLGFVVALIPYVREFFRRQLPSTTATQILADFDKVKRLVQEHQGSIHEKLVDIMTSRAAMHVAAMKKIDWEQAAADKSITVSPYVETLTKETATLQKVLAKHLPEPVVATILVPVFSSYRQQWSEAYKEVVLQSPAAKERLLADAEYFRSRIDKLEGSGDLGEHIVKVVTDKSVVNSATATIDKQHPVEQARKSEDSVKGEIQPEKPASGDPEEKG